MLYFAFFYWMLKCLDVFIFYSITFKVVLQLYIVCVFFLSLTRFFPVQRVKIFFDLLSSYTPGRMTLRGVRCWQISLSYWVLILRAGSLSGESGVGGFLVTCSSIIPKKFRSRAGAYCEVQNSADSQADLWD